MKKVNPGVMASQIWPTSSDTAGATLAAMKASADGGYFSGVQTVHVPNEEERREIGQFIKDMGLNYSYYFTRVLAREGLNLSDLDTVNRNQSWRTVVDRLDEAIEAGASSIGVVSGPAPEESGSRADALKALADSMCRICEAAAKTSDLTVLIEPLDYEVHKKNTLGTTPEAVSLCAAVKTAGYDLQLCIDSAHVLLNGEDVAESVVSAQQYLSQFHFCNPVLDPSSELYGDRHVPFGRPGLLSAEDLGPLLSRILNHPDYRRQEQLPIYLEVLNTEPENHESSSQLLSMNKTLLQRCFVEAGIESGGAE